MAKNTGRGSAGRGGRRREEIEDLKAASLPDPRSVKYSRGWVIAISSFVGFCTGMTAGIAIVEGWLR